MLERFQFSEAMRIDLTKAYAVYFTSQEPFAIEDADLFERLTGGRTVDASLNDAEVSKDHLVCLTIGAEVRREDGILLSLTISPTIDEDEQVTDIDPCEITTDREEVLAWIKDYAKEHKADGQIPEILTKIHEAV